MKVAAQRSSSSDTRSTTHDSRGSDIRAASSESPDLESPFVDGRQLNAAQRRLESLASRGVQSGPDVQMRAAPIIDRRPENSSIQQLQALMAGGVPSSADVQRHPSSPTQDVPTNTNSEIHAHARAGVRGGGHELPHQATIQRAFGSHDISHVQAYTGSDAQRASASIGARAYTTGNKVAFASRSPDLHITAHEAAHVVQQRAGVHLKDRVGVEGDRYERHADAVADAVVRGRSAEPLLDRFVDRSPPLNTQQNGGLIQRKIFADKDMKRQMLPKQAQKHLRDAGVHPKIARSLVKYYGDFNRGDIALGDLIRTAKQQTRNLVESSGSPVKGRPNRGPVDDAPVDEVRVDEVAPPGPVDAPVNDEDELDREPVEDAPVNNDAPDVDEPRALLPDFDPVHVDVEPIRPVNLPVPRPAATYMHLYRNRASEYFTLQNWEIPHYFEAGYAIDNNPQYLNMTSQALIERHANTDDNSLTPHHWASMFDPTRAFGGAAHLGHLTPVFYPENLPNKGGNVYRGDLRPPWDDSIQDKGGLRSWAASGAQSEYSYDILRHVIPQQSPNDSAYVSTSFNPSKAVEFATPAGYVYEISLPGGGIDVCDNFSTEYADEMELAVPDTVPLGTVRNITYLGGFDGAPRKQLKQKYRRAIIQQELWRRPVRELRPRSKYPLDYTWADYLQNKPYVEEEREDEEPPEDSVEDLEDPLEDLIGDPTSELAGRGQRSESRRRRRLPRTQAPESPYEKLYRNRNSQYFTLERHEIPDYFKAGYAVENNPEFLNMTSEALIEKHEHVKNNALVPQHWASAFDPGNMSSGSRHLGHLTPVFYPDNLPTQGGYVYRGDPRAPWVDSIKGKGGLNSWAASGAKTEYSMDILRHVVPSNSPDDSGYVSTSFSFAKAEEFATGEGFIYAIDVADGGINIKNNFRTDFSAAERELAVPGAIPLSAITSVFHGPPMPNQLPEKYRKKVIRGEFWENPIVNNLPRKKGKYPPDYTWADLLMKKPNPYQEQKQERKDPPEPVEEPNEEPKRRAARSQPVRRRSPEFRQSGSN